MHRTPKVRQKKSNFWGAVHYRDFYNFSLTYWTNSFHHDLRQKGRSILSAESIEIVGGRLSR